MIYTPNKALQSVHHELGPEKDESGEWLGPKRLQSIWKFVIKINVQDSPKIGCLQSYSI